ncbi:hypothetical protein [Embleya sp. NPDC050493]|uniref:hypothetical protein n=1 Tax=Embleya sp. NPDC050493 TaxID=3363989 RepID=UPI0037B4E121
MVDVPAVAQDASENVKPDKVTSGDKIDGVVAQVMALDQAQRREPEQRSAYEESNLDVV